MTGESLEAQIEAAWCALCDSPRARRYYLTDAGKLRHGDGAGAHVGTYTRVVTLSQFREDVFATYAELRGHAHAR